VTDGTPRAGYASDMLRRPSQLPTARWISNEPTEAQVRWVMRATWLMFAAGLVVVVFGHIPKL
jgi:hypothetical protein